MSIQVRIGTDLHELRALRPDRTMTTFSPEFFEDVGHGVFWICGKTDDHRTVYVAAARLFMTSDIKLDLQRLKVFYSNVEGRQDRCEVKGCDLSQIAGMVIHTGNLWVAESFRGRGYGALATRLVHLFALHRWPEAAWIWGLQEKELVYKGLWRDQGYRHCTGTVIWDHNPYARRFDMKVVYGSRAEILASLG